MRRSKQYTQAKNAGHYLEQRIKKTKTCWIWLKGKDKDGYGQCQDSRSAKEFKVTRAHQLSYCWFVGKVPRGKFVCHTCDNPSCVNPDHLFVGTPLENNHDMIRKKRARYPGATKRKLTREQVADIRRLKSKYTSSQLAAAYGVSFSLICMIWREEIWKQDETTISKK